MREKTTEFNTASKNDSICIWGGEICFGQTSLGLFRTCLLVLHSDWSCDGGNQFVLPQVAEEVDEEVEEDAQVHSFTRTHGFTTAIIFALTLLAGRFWDGISHWDGVTLRRGRRERGWKLNPYFKIKINFIGPCYLDPKYIYLCLLCHVQTFQNIPSRHTYIHTQHVAIITHPSCQVFRC